MLKNFCLLVAGILSCLSQAAAQPVSEAAVPVIATASPADIIDGEIIVSFDGASPVAVAATSAVSTSFAPAPSPTVAELAAEIEQLKAKNTKWEKFLAAMPRISGYAQLGYEWSETTSTFFIKRVRMSFSGNLAKKLDYRVQIEFASPQLVDAYLRYRPFDQLNFQVGEYKLPFSIENTDYVPLKLELIDYPLSLRRLMGFNDICGLSATGRDTGASVYGGFIQRDGYSIINYDLGVFNGEGINTRDKNKSKDIVARLMLKPLAGLTFAGSYYWGEYGKEYLKRIRYGAGACYDRGVAVLRGEYLRGTTGELESEGWYVLAGWRVTQTLQPLVRYDTFVENTARTASSRQTNYTAGLIWQPIKYLRCQLNYTYEDFAAREVSNRNVVALMLSGIF